MAQQTTLTPGGFPGRLYGSFGGKVEAAPEKGLGPFTTLHAMATPGRRFDFVSNPKDEAVVVVGVGTYKPMWRPRRR